MQPGIPYYCSICMSVCNTDEQRGSIYHPYFGEQEFRTIMDMILLMDEQMNQIGSWTELKAEMIPQRPCRQFQSVDMMQIEVVSRSNFTWQGYVTSPGKRTRKNFRSVLELLALLRTNLRVEME